MLLRTYGDFCLVGSWTDRQTDSGTKIKKRTKNDLHAMNEFCMIWVLWPLTFVRVPFYRDFLLGHLVNIWHCPMRTHCLTQYGGCQRINNGPILLLLQIRFLTQFLAFTLYFSSIVLAVIMYSMSQGPNSLNPTKTPQPAEGEIYFHNYPDYWC